MPLIFMQGAEHNARNKHQTAAADGGGKVTVTMQEPSAQAQQEQQRDEQTAPMPTGDRSQNRGHARKYLAQQAKEQQPIPGAAAGLAEAASTGAAKEGGETSTSRSPGKTPRSGSP